MNNFTQAFFHSSQIVCLVTSAYAFKGLETHWPTIFFIYFACFFTYNAERVFTPSPEDLENHPKRQRWIRSNELILKQLCIASLVLCLLLYSHLNRTQSVILFLCLIPTGLYLTPKIKPAGKRLKEFFLAKEISIALCWSLTTAFLSTQNRGTMFFVMLFILAFINTLACDLADSRGDRKYKIKTLANLAPQKTSGIIHLSSLGLSILALICQSPGFALAAIHIVIYVDKKDIFQYDLALIWPALFTLI